MLEWSRPHAAYSVVRADSVVVVAHGAWATGIVHFSFGGGTADPFAEPELLTVAAAFERFAGIDLLSTVRDGEGDRDVLAAAAKRRARTTADDTSTDTFSQTLPSHLQPNPLDGRFATLFPHSVP